MTELDQNQLARIEQSVSVEQIQLSEKLGAIKATSFIKKLVTVTEIKLISEIKETKQYKGLKVIDESGKVVTVTTWDHFCKYIGMSCEKVDEDIRNLGAFGEEFLETSQRMGLGYRDLRKLRKLDDADREVIINGESVKTEDRESLIDLIEEMSAKHRKEKEALESANKELKADKDALETVLQKKDEKVNQLDTQVTKLTSPAEIKRRTESEPQELEKAALETLGTESILFLTAFNRYTNALGGVMDIAESKDLPQLFERVDESLVATCQRFAHYVQRLGTQVSFEEILSPSWMFPEVADTDTSGQ
mgnify:CR=1 FL=1